MTKASNRNRTLRSLAYSTALTASLVGFAASAHAQNNTPANPTPALGAPTITTNGGAADGTPTNVRVQLNAPATIINWQRFSIANGSTAEFRTALAGNTAVLNRVTGGDLSQIHGSLLSDANVGVWLINPNGILFGSTGAVNTGSFVASTLGITDADFTTNALLGTPTNLTGAAGEITSEAGARLTANGGPLVLVAPIIRANGGQFRSNGNDVGFVTATNARVAASPGSPLTIDILAGTSVETGHVLNGSINGRNIYVAMAAQAGRTALLNMGAEATTASATNGIIVLGLAGASEAGGDVRIRDGLGTNTGGTVGFNVTGALNSAANDVAVRANGAVTVANNVTAGDDYRVEGASVTLGGAIPAVAQAARDAVTVTARAGGITGAAGLTLTSNSDGAGGAGDLTLGATGGGINFAPTTRLRAGTARQSNLIIRSDTAARALSLGDVEANGILSEVGGTPTADTIQRDTDIVLGDVTLNRRLTIETGGTGAVRTGDVVVGGPLSITSARNLTTGALTAQGTIQILGGAVGGTATLGALTANGAAANVLIDRADAVTTGALRAGNDVNIGGTGAPSSVTVNGAVDAGRDARFRAGSVTLNLAGDLTAGRNVALTAVSAGGAVRVTGGDLVADTGSVTIFGDNGAIDLLGARAGTFLNAGTRGALTATGNLIAANGNLLLSGGSLTLGAADGSARAIRATEGMSLLASAGGIRGRGALTVQANSDGVGTEVLSLTAGGDIDFDAASSLLGGTNRQSDVLVESDTTARLFRVGTVSANGLRGSIGGGVFATGVTRTADIITGDVTLNNALVLQGANVTSGALRGSEVRVTAANGLRAASVGAGGQVRLSAGAGGIDVAGLTRSDTSSVTADASGTMRLGGVQAGTSVSLGATSAPSSLTVGAIPTTTNAIVAGTGVTARSAGAASFAGTVRTSTGDVDLRATTTLEAQADVRTGDGAVTLRGGDVLVTGTVAATGLVDAESLNDTRLGAATTTGALRVQAGGLARLAGSSTTGGRIDITGGRVELGTVANSTIQAGRGIAVVATAAGPGVTGGAGLTLRSTSTNAADSILLRTNGAGGAINFAADSAIIGGTNRAIDVRVEQTDTTQALRLGDVTARALLGLGAGGLIDGSGTLTFGDLNLVNGFSARSSAAGDAITVGSVAITGAGQGLSLIADNGALVTPRNITVSGGVVLRSAADLVLDTVQGARIEAESTGGAATIARLTTTGGDALVRAAGTATVRGADVRGSYAVRGASVTLSGTQTATGAVNLTADGAGGTIRGLSGLTLTGDSDGTGDAITLAALNGSVNFDADTTINGGAARTGNVVVDAAAGAALRLGAVNALGLRSSALSGAITASEARFGALNLRNTLNVTATTGGISTGSITIDGPGQGLSLRALNGALSIPLNLTLDGDITLQSAADLTLGDIVSRSGAVDVRSTAGSLLVNNLTGATGALGRGFVNATANRITATGIGSVGLAATNGDATVEFMGAQSGGATLSAGGLATLRGADLRDTLGVTGGAVTLSGTIRTLGSAAITSSSGAIRGLSGLTLTVDRNSLGGQTLTLATTGAGGSIDFDPNTTINGGPLGTSSVLLTIGATQSLRLGNVNALALGRAGGGAITVANARLGNLSLTNQLSLDAVAGDIVAGRVSVTGAGQGVALSASGALSIGDVMALGNLNLAGATGVTLASAVANGATTITSATGGVVSTGLVAGATGATVRGAGPVSVRAVTSSNGAILVESTGGSAAVGEINALNGSATVRAGGGAATVSGPVNVRAAYTVEGRSVTLGGIQSAGGGVSLRSTAGGITGLAGLTLTANSDGVGAEPLDLEANGGGIDFAVGTRLLGGPNRQSLFRITTDNAGSALRLGDVDALGVQARIGAGAFTGTLLREGAITLGSVRTVNPLAISATGATGAISATSIRSEGGVTLTASGLIGVGSITSGGAVRIGQTTGAAGGFSTGGIVTTNAADGDIVVDKAGLVSIGAFDSAGNITVGGTQRPQALLVSNFSRASGSINLNAVGSVTVRSGIDAGGSYRIDAGSITLGSTAAAVAQRARGAVSLFSNGGAMRTLGDLLLTANSDGVGGEALTVQAAGGDVLLGGATLNGGTAGARSAVTVTADAANAIQLGTVNAGAFGATGGRIAFGTVSSGAATLVATGAGAGDGVVGGVLAASGNVRIEALSGGGGVRIDDAATGAGAGLDIRSRGAIRLDRASVGGATRLETIAAGGADITLTGGLTSAGSAQLLSAGGVFAPSITSTNGALVVTAAGAVRGLNTGERTSLRGADVTVTAGSALLDTVAATGTAPASGNVGITAGTVDVLTVSGSNAVNVSGTNGVTFGQVSGGTTTIGSSAGEVRGSTASGTSGLTIEGLAVRITAARSADGAVTLRGLGTNGAISVTEISARTGATATADTIGLDVLNVEAGGATLTGRLVRLGTASVGAAGVASDLRITGTERVDVTGAVSVRGSAGAGNLVVSGGNIALGDDADDELMQATGRVDLTATTGAIRGGAGLTLRSDSDGDAATDGVILDAATGIDFAAATVEARGARGANVGIRTGAGAPVTFGTLRGGQIGGIDAGHTSFTPMFEGSGPFSADLIEASSLGVNLSAGAIRIGTLTASGGVSLATPDAVSVTSIDAESLGIRTGGALTGAGYTTSGALTLEAASIALDSVRSTAGAVSATATAGNLAIRASNAAGDLTLRTTGRGDIDLATTDAGGATQVQADDGRITLGTVTGAGNVGVRAMGSILGRGGADATVRSTGGDVTVASLGGEARLLLAEANRNATVTARSVTAATARAGGALNLTSTAGDLSLGTGNAGGAATLRSAGAARVGSLTTGGDTAITAAGLVDLGTLASGGAATLNAGTDLTAGTIDAVGTADLRAGGAARVGTLNGGAVVVNAGSADLDRVRSGSTLGVTTTGGALRVNVGEAAGAATLTSAGDLAVATSLTTGGSAALTAAGDAAATLLEIGGGLTVNARDVAIATARVGGDAAVAASRNVALGQLTSGGAASVSAGGGIDAGTIAATRAADLRAGGAARVGTLSGGSVSVIAGSADLETVTSGSTLAVTANAGALRIGTGRAGTTATLDARGPLTVSTSLTSGGDAVLTSADAMTLAAVESTGGNVSGTAQRIDVTTARAAGRLGLTATAGDVTLGTGAAGGDAALTASGAIGLGTLTSGGAATLRAGTTITGGTLTAAGAADLRSGGATTVSTLRGGSVQVVGGSANLGTVMSGGALAVRTTGGELRIGVGEAGGATTLDANGRIVVSTSLRSGGSASLTATGDAELGSVESTGGDLSVRANAIRANLAKARGALALTGTGGAIDLDRGEAGSAATLDARGVLGVRELLAGGDATLTATGAATVGAVESTGGDVSLTAASGTVTDARAARALTLRATGGSLTLGAGRAGTTALLDATGDVQATTLNSGGAATVTSGANARIGDLAVAAGAVRVGAAGAVTGLGADGRANLSAGGAGSAVTVEAGALARLGTVVGAGDVTVRAASIDGTTLRATGGALSLEARNGALTVGTGAAGTTATLRSTGATGVGTLTAGGAATLDSGAVVTVGTLQAGATRITSVGATQLGTTTATGPLTVSANGVTATGRTTVGGALTVTSGGAISLADTSATGAATLNAQTTINVASLSAGATTITSGGATTLGTTTTGGALTVTANGIAAGRTNVTGDLRFTSGGAVTLAEGVATGLALIDANGLASLGALTAGPSITVRALDAAITGVQRAAAVTFVNRAPATQNMRIGDVDASLTGGFRLSDAEVDFIDAGRLTFDAGAGSVDFGTLSFTAAAGRTNVDVLSTGDLSFRGVVSGAGVGRVFRFGGAAGSGESFARTIRLIATSEAGGRLLFGDADLDLRGERIVQGQSNLVDSVIGLSGAEAAARFVSNSASALYNSIVGGRPYSASAQTTLSAGRLTVRYTNFALFQNTAPLGLNAGAVLGGTVSAPIAGALQLVGPGTLIPNSFALFGTVNGVGDTGTAVLGSSVLITNGVDLSNSRVNGCLIGTGAGCLTTVVANPPLNIFDASRLDVFRTEDDFTIPFDPVVGGNNEALFTGLDAISIPITSSECDDNDAATPCAANQEKAQ